MKDSLFNAWTERVPTLKPNSATSPAWWVYLCRDGKWKRASLKKYKKALKFLHKAKYEDFSIHSKRQPFNPPVVRDKTTGEKSYWRRFPKDHIWCHYCRRPTVFATFKKHHAVPPIYCTSYEPRCTICGTRLEFLPQLIKGLL